LGDKPCAEVVAVAGRDAAAAIKKRPINCGRSLVRYECRYKVGHGTALAAKGIDPMKRWTMMALGCVVATAWVAGQATTQPATDAGATTKALAPDQLIHNILSSGSDSDQTLPSQVGPLPHDATSGAAAVAPGAPAVTVLREGTYLIDRTGRLTHSADGQQAEFTFDADSQTLRDPPVIILPNLKLMQMESAVGGSNRDLRFRITGMVTEYRSRNYILLEKVVVVPDVTQQF
jgi:hypothetical protein